MEISILKQMLEEYVSQARFDGMSKSEKGKFVEALTNSFNDRITASIMSNMPSEYLNEFEEVLQRNDPQETDNFMRSAIPNFDSMLMDEVNAYIQDLMMNP